ncbi:hypothetical protein HPB51_005586 [Rhipicephalus microplus]|uniref:Uncharacterized protein n=1 Tax=Rhipicephalus microplus TaxID=6941 RepID=A0A9J6E618_RHIMP|nr:hypothetical protein HPB51_005586 [Rhipicephalus microplus]
MGTSGEIATPEASTKSPEVTTGRGKRYRVESTERNLKRPERLWHRVTGAKSKKYALETRSASSSPVRGQDRDAVAQRPYSPEEEDVLVADVSISSKPSTGLSRMTTSMQTMQQQRAADSSTIQGATTKDCTLSDESTNQREVVLVDSGNSMYVQSSGGPLIPAKRGPPVVVHQQDAIALEQPPKNVAAIPDNASTLSASQSYPMPAPSQF